MLNRFLDKLSLRKKYSRRSSSRKSLRIESLEERRLLATVLIAAAGTTGQEEMQLLINDQLFQTWTNVGGNPAARQFFDFVTDVPDTVTVNQIKVRFANDLYDPAQGIDRNLVIDDIRLANSAGLASIEAESSTVFSSATWTSADGIKPGYGRGEMLNANGYLQFSDGTNNGSQIVINAKGLGGPASFNLLIDGAKVASYVANTQSTAFTFQAARPVTADRIRVEFTGDQYDPANNIDINLQVDNIVVDGTTFLSDDYTVYSTGTWQSADGVTPGFSRGLILNANGFFQYNARPAQSYQSIGAMGTISGEAIISKFNAASGRYATIEFSSTERFRALFLYEPSGRRVSTFGSNGEVSLNTLFPNSQSSRANISITDIAFFADGSLLLTGKDTTSNTPLPFLAKIKTNGQVDTTFTGNASIRTFLGAATSSDLILGAVVDASNNITVVGTKLNSTSSLVAIRLNSNGTVNTTWGTGGSREINFAGANISYALFKKAFVLSNGSLLIDAAVYSSTDNTRRVVKLTASGMLDTSFGVGGTRTVLPEQNSLYGILVNANAQSQVDRLGRIVFVSSNEIVRLTTRGNFDATFGANGRIPNVLQFDPRRGDSFSIDNLNRIVVVKNNYFVPNRFTTQYISTDIMRITSSGALDKALDGDGIQNLNVRGKLLGFDKAGNMMLSVASTGSSSDVLTSQWKLSRYRFA